MWWKLPKAMSDVLLNVSFVQGPRGNRTAIKTPQVANEAKHQRHNAILQTQKFHKCPWLQLVKAICRRRRSLDRHGGGHNWFGDIRRWMAIIRWSFSLCWRHLGEVLWLCCGRSCPAQVLTSSTKQKTHEAQSSSTCLWICRRCELPKLVWVPTRCAFPRYVVVIIF